MNIWASARTTKSKRIPRQRNYFIQEQNLHTWTADMGFFYLIGPSGEPSQEWLLWAIYHHGRIFLYMGKYKCQTTLQ